MICNRVRGCGDRHLCSDLVDLACVQELMDEKNRMKRERVEQLRHRMAEDRQRRSVSFT